MIATSWSFSINDSIYPKLLREVYNPPKKLFYKGRLEVLNKVCISVVGTRRNTDYGEMMVEKIVEELAVLDIAIVSGLAKGIDAIAHKAALKNNLPTIAVLGSGINNIYPKVNESLAKEIEQNGLILSEYEDMTAPITFQFPQRNRIISGLSLATIVIESPESSGSLITAKLALEQGREIFVVPGDVDRESSLGPLKLLQNGGAYPISSGKDVIEILKKQPHLFKIPASQETQNSKISTKIYESTTINYNFTKEQSVIFSALSKRRPHSLDQIKSKTGLPTEIILQNLSILEIQSLVKAIDDDYLQMG